MELTLTYVNITEAHPTDLTEPAAVNCPQQTESTGGHKQPAIDGTHGGDMNNQVSEIQHFYEVPVYHKCVA